METQIFLARTNWGSVSEDILVINSKLASPNFFYAGYNHCILDITPAYHLGCYEDDTLGAVQISEEPGDDIQFILGTKEVIRINNLNLFPNRKPTAQKMPRKPFPIDAKPLRLPGNNFQGNYEITLK